MHSDGGWSRGGDLQQASRPGNERGATLRRHRCQGLASQRSPRGRFCRHRRGRRRGHRVVWARRRPAQPDPPVPFDHPSNGEYWRHGRLDTSLSCDCSRNSVAPFSLRIWSRREEGPIARRLSRPRLRHRRTACTLGWAWRQQPPQGVRPGPGGSNDAGDVSVRPEPVAGLHVAWPRRARSGGGREAPQGT